MSELKACPWCGGDANAIRVAHWPVFTSVECAACGTSLRRVDHAAAIAAWNRRAPAALPTREDVMEAIWRAWSPQCDRCDVLRGCGCSEAAADAVLALMGRTA